MANAVCKHVHVIPAIEVKVSIGLYNICPTLHMHCKDMNSGLKLKSYEKLKLFAGYTLHTVLHDELSRSEEHIEYQN